ncbi:MAG: hypothetical protein R3E79_33640 [Caldilineaceae bacterium]
MRKFMLFSLLFFMMGLAGAGGRTAQASTVSRMQGGTTRVETAPLPPPTATSTAGAGVIAHLNEPFTLRLQQWASLRETPEPFSVQLATLVRDSRCPAGVNCVVAGQVEFTLRAGRQWRQRPKAPYRHLPGQ